MRFLSIFIFLCVAVFYLSTAFGWELLIWFNDFQVFHPNGLKPLQPYCLVQLIADGGKDGVDDPYQWWMSQPNPNAAMQWWLANGCPPIGDDYLVPSFEEPNPTYIMDFTSEPDYDPQLYDGWFASFIEGGTPSGVGLYTRGLTSQNPQNGDYYGTVGAEEMSQPFIMYQLDNPVFPTYAVHGGTVDQLISIPEPATISISSGFLLLFYFIQRKKNG